MKIYKLFVLLLLGSFLVSCSDWFDVIPRKSVYEEDLYDSEDGYLKVLTGLYIQMGEDALYGKNATYGLMDVVSGMYYISSTYTESYKYAAQYNYEYSATKGVISSIWDEAYNVIARTNELLRMSGIGQDVDPDRTRGLTPSDVFDSDQTRDIITGEALALRAYLHFDLLRMFGMNPVVDINKPSIPYVTVMQKDVTPQSTVGEAIRKIESDLLQAERLLRNTDPVVKNNPQISETIYTPAYRLSRMNYYAVCGLLARFYTYAGGGGNLLKARVWAEKVIDAGTFSWTKVASWNQGDFVGVRELVFYLYVEDMESRITPYFKQSDDDRNVFALQDDIYKLYAPTDRRAKGYVSRTTDISVRVHYPQKYVVNKDRYADSIRMKIPMIRLSEMYYIMAESYVDEDINEANKYLNSIRTARGMAARNFTRETIGEELENEYKREFVSEGQLFYYVKRHNSPLMINTQFKPDFVFPLPENEYLYGNRKQNK